MLEDKDIEKLSTILATKKDLEGMATKEDLEKMADNNLKLFASKKDFQELKNDVADLKELMQSLVVSVDKMVKSIEILGSEYKAMSVQLTRHEKWIKQLSDKLGVTLSFE